MPHIIDGWFRADKSLLPDREIASIKKQLIIPNYEYAQAKQMGHKYDGPKKEKLYEETETHLLIPRHFGLNVLGNDYLAAAAHLHKAGVEGMFEDRRVSFRPADDRFELLFTPRNEHQAAAVTNTVNMLHRDSHGAMLVAPCGSGKTIMGLEAIRRLREPAAVFVHKTFLMDQWLEGLEKIMPEASVGIVQGPKCDWNKDVVLCMIQSLVSEQQYPPELFSSRGIVVSDEAHRLGAVKWRKAIVQFPALYRLLLTATPERPDGRHVVFIKHVGGDHHLMPDTGLKPRIEALRYNGYYDSHSYTNSWNGKVNLAKLITMLGHDDVRTERILRAAVVPAVRAGRQILVLSDRIEHLERMESRLQELAPSDTVVAKYVGGMKQEARSSAAMADVILGTYGMAQEGLDIPSLSVLVMATPRAKVQQPVGRVLRSLEGKGEPVVVDVLDTRIPICGGLHGARKKVYQELGYQ
jgi:superfamily II DNA or RNA helicase